MVLSKCVSAEKVIDGKQETESVYACLYIYIYNASFSTPKQSAHYASIYSMQPLQHHGQCTIYLKCRKPFTNDYICGSKLLSNMLPHFNQHPIL